MKIKVCGLKQIQNIKDITEAGADFAGMIFYDKSPRFVNGSLNFEELANVNIKKVGVFVNESIDSIAKTITKYDLYFIQLHGNESPEVCKELMPYAKIIKAFGVDADFDFKKLDAYQDFVGYFLFDTATPNYGGSGKSFDYELLNNYHLEIPFIISGGISLENIKSIKQIKRERLFGVDINSKFEISPGLKDAEKIKQFIKQLK